MVGTQFDVSRKHRIGLTVALLMAASSARAQEEAKSPPPREQLGSERQLALSVERVLSVTSELPRTDRTTYMDGGSSEYTQTSTTLMLLGRPALAVDAFLWKHLSLGLKASLGGTSHKQDGRSSFDGVTSTSHNQGSSVSMTLSPRMGAAFTAESGIGVWARAGADVYFYSSSNAQRDHQGSFSYRDSSVLYGAQGDLLLTYSPLPHFVLTAGPFYQVRFAKVGEDFHSAGFNVNAGIFL